MLKFNQKKYFMLTVTIFLCISSLFILFFNQSNIDLSFKTILAIYSAILVLLNIILFNILKTSLKQKNTIKNLGSKESMISIKQDEENAIKLSNYKKSKEKKIKLKNSESKNNSLLSNANLLTQSNKNINSLYTKIKELSKFNNNIKTYSKESSSNFKEILKSDDEIRKSIEAIDSKTREITSMVIELGNAINKLDNSVEKLNALIFDISIEDNSNKDNNDNISSKIKEIRQVSKEVLVSSKEITNLIYKVKYETYNLSTLNQSTFLNLDKKYQISSDFIPCFDNILGEVSNIMSNLLDLYKIADTNLEIRNNLLQKAKLIPSNQNIGV